MASTESPTVTGFQDYNDNGASKPSCECLGTPVVLRIIMEHLSNTDLLAISLVNKLWNYEARSVLKYRGTLVATLRSISPCKKVGAFASDLRQMNVVPFAGINIDLERWWNCEGCEASSTGALNTNYSIILDRVKWKHLRFRWGRNWEEDKKCQAFLLAQKILKDWSEDLQELKVRLGERSEKFMQEILQTCSFPQLKTLDLRAVRKAEDEDSTALTKVLLSRAPKLQEFHEYSWVNLEENVTEGGAVVLITHYPLQPAYTELPEDVLATLRVVDMNLQVQEQDFSVERFNRIVPLLLENSKTTLKGLWMDAVLVMPLMCYGIPLESVTVLSLDFNHLEITNPRVLTFLKAFDFTRMFPNLSKVRIGTASHHVAPEQINEFILQGNALLPSVPNPDRTANIEELSISGYFEDDVIPFLAQMFPSTKALSTKRREWLNSHEQEFPYGLIWDSFKNLEKLDMIQRGDYYQKMWPENFDSVFCGIFPEEVAQLKEKDDEYLRNVNIVPVMPAITCLSGLKHLDIVVRNEDFDNPGVHDRPLALGAGAPLTKDYGTFLFSKVTGLIAFARIPRLAVSIAIHGDIPEIEQVMSHLKPYATVSIGLMDPMAS